DRPRDRGPRGAARRGGVALAGVRRQRCRADPGHGAVSGLAITGVGAIAPGATGREELARLLVAPPCEPERLAVEGRRLLVRRAGDVPGIAAREARRMPRPSVLALCAAREALAGRAFEDLALAVGTGYGAVESTRLALE